MFNASQFRKLFLGVLMLLPASAFAWWNEEWPYRAPVTIDTSASGANIVSAQGETTVLVRLHAGNFQDFFLVKEDLADLRFIAGDDKTPLKFHVEKFDLVNQMMYIWVKLPQLSGNVGTEKFWMYYGNAQAPSAADAGGSFDASTATVIHFREGAAPADETANAIAVTNQDAVITPASLIAAGSEFKGTGKLLLAAQGALAILPENGMTFSAWIKPDLLDPETYLLHWSDGVTDLAIKMNQSQISAHLTAGGKQYVTQPAGTIAAATWQHITLSLAKDQMTLYVNERQVGQATVSWPSLGGQIAIGNALNANEGFSGQIDEVRIDRTARSADWAALASRNQGQEDKLLKIQQAEQLGAGGHGDGGIIKVILESNDAAGWAVMGLCFIMALGSWLIMGAKAISLGRMSKDNRRFLAAYEKLGTSDPAVLDRPETADEKERANSPVLAAMFGKHDHFQSSPLYHMYHRGIEEVRSRIGTSVGARAAGLSSSAIDTMRAMLDAKMTREMQALNKYMIFLVITISGGPFLGLLGTVIGVMITFGAIAATGDVNIAAIAPGVAAALSATVAGLVAAIPALFGYNYLTSRIKEQAADMRVFADEFLAKLAEHYGTH